MGFFYDIMSGIPWTPINCIWLGFALFQTFGFIIIYHTKEGQFTQLKSLLQSLSALGKSRTTPHRFDVPKHFFTHFYIIASVWNGFVFIKILFGDRNSDIINLFQLPSGSGRSGGDLYTLVMAVSMIWFHVIRRLYECCCVSVFSPGCSMSPVIYAWGCFYYVILTVTIFAESLPADDLSWHFKHVLTTQQVLGTCVYLVGVLVQHHSIDALAQLRKENPNDTGNRHLLPFGGLFAYVSNPHYLGELLIYSGVWIVIGRQSKSFTLVMFYLVITHMHLAKSSHLWYQKNFPCMPKERKALLPFVW